MLQQDQTVKVSTGTSAPNFKLTRQQWSELHNEMDSLIAEGVVRPARKRARAATVCRIEKLPPIQG